MTLGFCFVLSSGALLSVGRFLVIFEGGLRPPYFLMTLGFCFVSSSGALFYVGRCLVLFEGGLRPPYSLMTLGFLLCCPLVLSSVLGAVLSGALLSVGPCLVVLNVAFGHLIS
jgi:hypothetical protein